MTKKLSDSIRPCSTSTSVCRVLREYCTVLYRTVVIKRRQDSIRSRCPRFGYAHDAPIAFDSLKIAVGYKSAVSDVFKTE